MGMKTLGLHASTAPTIKNREVTNADFSIAGIIGKNDRQFTKAFLVKNIEEAVAALQEANSANYLQDGITGFFANIRNIGSQLWIKTSVGNAAGTPDAVAATKSPLDGSGATTVRLDSAAYLYTSSMKYEQVLAYGSAGNRIGYKITNGARFTTEASATALASATTIFLDSVIGIKVGDYVRIVLTGGLGATVHHKVTVVNEGDRSITWADGNLDPAGTSTLAVNDVVTVRGFRIQTYYKNVKGVVVEVDVERGKIYCTMEAENTDYYVNNVFSTSPYLKATDLASASVGILSFPADVATITYLLTGANGTAPTDVTTWAETLTAFNGINIRQLVNMETADVTIQKAGETYCAAREIKPVWHYLITESQSKAQLVTIGSLYQRSDEVSGVAIAHWLGVTDPFSVSESALDRHVPNLGHEMGKWIRAISQFGIHWIYAVQNIVTYGANSVIGTQFLEDTDRTELADAGINCIESISGVGIVTRNLFTMSTALEYKYGNILMMKSFFQASFIEALRDEENTPNSVNRINANRDKMLNFMYKMWRKGSNNATPEGEFYGQYQNEDGTLSKPEDHFFVRADATVNPLSEIQAGNRNFQVYFTGPAPTGRIEVSVGLML